MNLCGHLRLSISAPTINMVFFITDDGYLISNYHVVKDASKVRLVTSAGTVEAKVV
jgi:S1-C subfamily serine protease